jgi:mono/diheme cytochrome c family protein
LSCLVLAAGVVFGTQLAQRERSVPREKDRPTQHPSLAQSDVIVRGRHLYVQWCAACHGLQGEGQPDWKVPLPDGSLPAPPQDSSGHTWHHADQQLRQIIAEGGTAYDPRSAMPAFGAVLAESDTEAVLQYIKSLWGPRERAFQEEQTRQWRAAEETATP